MNSIKNHLSDIELNVNFANLELENPLIASAGPVTATIKQIEKLAKAGIGAVITKTGFIEKEYYKWVERKNIFPYKPVNKYLSLEHGSLLFQPTLADVPVEKFCKRIQEMKKFDIPIIASIMGLSVEGYVKSAQIMEEAGADAIELDFCCTIPEFTSIHKYAGDSVNFNPNLFAKIIKRVKKAVSIPVGPKSNVNISIAHKILTGVIKTKVSNSAPDFITLSGQLAQNPGINIETFKPFFPAPALGWGGKGSNKSTFAGIALFSTTIGFKNTPISAVGGIANYKDVITCLALGSTTIQMQSAIMNIGPSLITKLRNDLMSFLNERGITKIREIIGKSVDQMVPAVALGEFWRVRDSLYKKVYADIDPNLCNKCGICMNICLDDAIFMNDIVKIDKNKCRGCNLCVLKCPQNAITLQNIELYNELLEKYMTSIKADIIKDFMEKDKVGLWQSYKFYRDLKKWRII